MLNDFCCIFGGVCVGLIVWEVIARWMSDQWELILLVLAIEITYIWEVVKIVCFRIGGASFTW